VIAYSVLTEGCALPVSICEIMLADTPTSRARARRLRSRASRSARMRSPSGGTSEAGMELLQVCATELNGTC
jgi:hypothetical protein